MNGRTTVGALGLALAIACATSPTGRKQLILLPEDEVAALGVTAFEEMKQEQPLSSDAALSQYVNCVAGAVLAGNRDRVSGAWEIRVFASEQVNAFALPGRKIGIYEGMAKFADTPAQLAAVIGHEIGHVLAQHGNERMSEAMAAQGALSLLEAYEGGGENKELLLGALGLGYQYGRAMPHSRTQETEADEIGLVLMAKAGYDPQDAVALWRKMAQRGDAGPEFLSTHPAPENRAKALTEQQSEVQPLFSRARAAGRNPTCAKP